MSLSYRTVPDNDEYRSTYRRLLQYAFVPERGPDWDGDPPDPPAEFEPRGLYEQAAEGADESNDGRTTDSNDGRTTDSNDGRTTDSNDGRTTDSNDGPTSRPRDADDVDPSSLVVAGALIDFRLSVRGAYRPVGGVTAIASPPERRRRGYVGTLLDHMHGELRGRDVSMAVLWPFSHPFYARFGYGRTNDYAVHEFPPSALDTPAATPTEDGCLCRLSADSEDDIDALVRLHETAAPEPLALRRSTDWWRLRVFRSWTETRFVYGWTDTDGELRSYLAYRFEDGNGDAGRTLVVDFWGATDDEAYRHLLGFLRNHDSQVSTVRLLAGDTSLLDRLSDPREDVNTEIKPGPMVRIVDVEAALSGVVTSATDTRVVLRVRDTHHDWNDGRFELGVRGGETTCRRLTAVNESESESESEREVAVDIGALSRLVVGSRSTAALTDIGQLDGDGDAIARLGSLLPPETPAPYLREWF